MAGRPLHWYGEAVRMTPNELLEESMVMASVTQLGLTRSMEPCSIRPTIRATSPLHRPSPLLHLSSAPRPSSAPPLSHPLLSPLSEANRRGSALPRLTCVPPSPWQRPRGCRVARRSRDTAKGREGTQRVHFLRLDGERADEKRMCGQIDRSWALTHDCAVCCGVVLGELWGPAPQGVSTEEGTPCHLGLCT